MSIGTAKPSSEQLELATHAFINHISIYDEYSVGDYYRECSQYLSEYFQKNTIAIAAGGTGLYLKALSEGLDDFPPVSKETRSYYSHLHAQQGLQALQKELLLKDPKYYDKVDISNPHRLIRALSIIKETGQAFSSFLKRETSKLPYKTILIHVTLPRELLYQRINQRVDSMINNGLVDEVRELQEHRSLQALNSVGYKEIFEYLDGDCSLDEAIDRIKQHSRNYAKRQITWFNNQQNYKSFDVRQYHEILDYILSEVE